MYVHQYESSLEEGETAPQIARVLTGIEGKCHHTIGCGVIEW